MSRNGWKRMETDENERKRKKTNENKQKRVEKQNLRKVLRKVKLN